MYAGMYVACNVGANARSGVPYLRSLEDCMSSCFWRCSRVCYVFLSPPGSTPEETSEQNASVQVVM